MRLDPDYLPTIPPTTSRLKAVTLCKSFAIN